MSAVRRAHVGEARRAVRRSLVRFTPIQQLRAHEYVAEQLRRHIALGLVPPGMSLPAERDLAAMFGVGRPTVNHALRLLEADRLVETRRGRHGGSFVVHAREEGEGKDETIARVRRDAEGLTELLDFRRAVEPAVARLAAGSRRRGDMTAMRRAAAELAEADDEHAYMRLDTEFHLALASATRNRFLVAAVEDVRVGLNDAIALLPESDLWHRRIEDEHAALVAAVEAHDAHAAEAVMTTHVTNAEQSIRAILDALRRRSA